MTDTKYTLDNLIAFLQSKPSDEEYDPTYARECALAQWVESVTGKQGKIVECFGEHYTFVYITDEGETNLYHMKPVAYGDDQCSDIVQRYPETAGNTFGQALKRALIMKQEQESANA